MQREKLITKLNWFYNLELHQVDLYTSQAHAVEDIYLAKALSRFATIKQQHVDDMVEAIKQLGAQPIKLGDVISPILGRVVGTLTGALGVKNLLKLNITLEEKAMKDYKDLILKVDNPHLFEILWSNLIDEDLHSAWMANKLKELESITE
ncbi:ferritin-like domain-containing protein [Desulfolucanica intricata]|uniref:ferritin-like domain-containing protein n=1 Tax=Desulfolucanica intricata TaxID=1285191 RepID=UPI0009EEB09E|nr:ferritin-like domain-containing protein [Desulfolucanica intricata]